MSTDRSAPAVPATATWRAKAPGLAVSVVIALVATAIGTAVPVIGSPVSGVVLGVLVGVLVRRRARASSVAALSPGLKLASKLVLQIAVVLLGARLSLAQVAQVGVDSLPVMLGTVVVCLVGAAALGRLLGIDSELRVLIGTGTAICGASAIAAVTPVVRASGSSVAYALSTVFAFNIAAVLLFPPLGQLLGMSEEAFGLFAGTAVNDTSSVVAAATTFGSVAADHAVVVKLVRTLLIIPIVIGLALLVARRDRRTAGDDAGDRPAVWRLVPWFLVGFLLLATLNSIGLVPKTWHDPLATAATFLITVALTAIGLSTDVPALRAAGLRPLLFGGMLWVLVTLSALGVMALTGAI
ncbi:putative sulfate exporter family transporter [Georgenia satyanarayanai]|uniref:YeiH family protein n=1 Tax=Georgenia satyanarayanai TaxID=860221 RepID=UPI00204267CA|nr:putative sulfate exporter family transporter [Georgenia satyanarayanai]MCM3659867.1 putative sulfate exporter family transporter [Georgenia satyanarayanai]